MILLIFLFVWRIGRGAPTEPAPTPLDPSQIEKKKIIYLAFVPLIIVILIQVKCLLFNAAALHTYTTYTIVKVIINIVG